MIILDPIRVLLKFRPVNQVFATDDLAEPFPDGIVADCDYGPAIRRRESVIGINKFVAVADTSGIRFSTR